MITIKNARTLDGRSTDIFAASSDDLMLDAEQYLLLPALIDPHISFGNPNSENWIFGIESAVRGGISTVLDIPSEPMANGSIEGFQKKKQKIDKLFEDLKIPLHYFPYVKANSHHIEELGIHKEATLGSLLLFFQEDHPLDEKTWDRIFQIAAWEDLPVLINAANENSWKQSRFNDFHESILGKAIHYAERQNARLYVLNVSTKEEIDLINEARQRSILIYAETTPQHLFPIQSSQADFLWDALGNGIIETIGSGYFAEKEDSERLLWHGSNFAFSNPLFLLPLLMTAFQEGKISIENIVRATRVNYYDIFKLEKNTEDFVLVDLEKQQKVQRINKEQSEEIILKGWPAYTLLRGHLFKLGEGGYHLERMD